MFDSTDGKVRYPADCISELEDKCDIHGLIQVVEAGENKYRKPAINALGRLKAKQTVELLLDLATRDKLVSIRSAAILALGEIGTEEAVDPIIFIMGKDKSVRLATIEAPGKIRSSKAVAPLVILLNDEDEEGCIREKAIEVLTEIANTDAIKSLVGIIEDENTDIADKAMMGIRKLGKKSVKSLIDAAGSGNIHMRRKATNLLGEIGELEAIEALISILENWDEDNELRGEAAEALGRIGDHTATAVLIRSVINDEEYSVRCQSVMALGNVGDPDAGEALLTIVDCKDNPSRIRGLAFEALGKIGYKKAAKLLMDVLKDERNDSWLKDNAVWALGEMRIDESAPLIMKYVRDCWKSGYVDGIGKGIEALDKMGVFDIDR